MAPPLPSPAIFPLTSVSSPTRCKFSSPAARSYRQGGEGGGEGSAPGLASPGPPQPHHLQYSLPDPGADLKSGLGILPCPPTLSPSPPPSPIPVLLLWEKADNTKDPGRGEVRLRPRVTHISHDLELPQEDQLRGQELPQRFLLVAKLPVHLLRGTVLVHLGNADKSRCHLLSARSGLLVPLHRTF